MYDAKMRPCQPLRCDAIKTQVKRFYDERSEWSSLYRMTPIKSNKVNDVECDVLYAYDPVPRQVRRDGLYQERGRDKRRFRFSPNDACQWTVESMGGYHSGESLPDTACLDLQCDDVRSLMKRAIVDTGELHALHGEQDMLVIKRTTKVSDAECDASFGSDRDSDDSHVHMRRFAFGQDQSCDWTVRS